MVITQLVLAVLFAHSQVSIARRYSQQKVIEALNQEDLSQNGTMVTSDEKMQPDWKDVDGLAFGKGYLTGFYMILTPMPRPMVWSVPAGPSWLGKLARQKTPKWYLLDIPNHGMFKAGHPAPVTRVDIVPKVSAMDIEATRTRILAIQKDLQNKSKNVGSRMYNRKLLDHLQETLQGLQKVLPEIKAHFDAPEGECIPKQVLEECEICAEPPEGCLIAQPPVAKFFAYVKFAETVDGKSTMHDPSSSFRYGGFVYFASEWHVEAGLPMEHMNVLAKSDCGTMRFKEQLETFWQVKFPGKEKGGRLVTLPPQTCKEINEKHANRHSTVIEVKIPKVLTYSWYNKPPWDGSPADTDELKCHDRVANGWEQCTLTTHEPEKRLSISTVANPYPEAGVHGQPDARWFPVTAESFMNAGAIYYTWVMPNELGHSSGGFLYIVQDGKAKTRYRFFEMLSELCRATGLTLYDNWIEKFKKGDVYPGMMGEVQAQQLSTPRTLVFVIDMQNDFIGMNFQMPCHTKRHELITGLSKFVTNQFKEGATIVASLDYHPQNHCGVDGSCKNDDPVYFNYSKYADGTMHQDAAYYKGKDSERPKGRYTNRFPPHCEYYFETKDALEDEAANPVVHEDETARSVPLEGAKFYPAIRDMLANLAEKDETRTRVHTIFKAFQKEKDSFSALPHMDMETGKTETSTGGYALSMGKDSASSYTPWPKRCYQARPDKDCFPTRGQITDPSQANSMWDVKTVLKSLLKTGEHFDRIIVTGLVWDFCVKETAFNAQKLFPGTEVIVPIELARPAMEGGEVPAFGYPPAGLGTNEIIERTEHEYIARGIKLVSMNAFQ